MSETMTGWQDISTAPKGWMVLLFGTMRDHEYIRATGTPMVFTGYWDELDDAWCATGSTWTGPFFEPTHWQPLPPPPTTVNK